MMLRTITISAVTSLLLVAACGGGGGGGGSVLSGADKAMMERATALASAIEAPRSTGADGAFDDTAYMVAPAVVAANDATTVTIEVTETGTPQGGSTRSGEFSMVENGPAAISGWAGARFRRGETNEHLVVYTNVGASQAMAFTPENLNRLREVSGLTGEAVEAPGLTVQVPAWLPLIRSTSLAAASPRGSVTYGTTGTGVDEGRTFTGSFSGAPGTYSRSSSSCSVTLDDRGCTHCHGRRLDLRVRRGRDGEDPGL